MLKRYKYPEETLAKLDLKVKLPALSPVEEFEAHQLPTTCIQFEKELIVSGSQDGEVFIRNLAKPAEIQKIKVGYFY